MEQIVVIDINHNSGEAAKLRGEEIAASLPVGVLVGVDVHHPMFDDPPPYVRRVPVIAGITFDEVAQEISQSGCGRRLGDMEVG